jgi:hypothetical protein
MDYQLQVALARHRALQAQVAAQHRQAVGQRMQQHHQAQMQQQQQHRAPQFASYNPQVNQHDRAIYNRNWLEFVHHYIEPGRSQQRQVPPHMMYSSDDRMRRRIDDDFAMMFDGYGRDLRR